MFIVIIINVKKLRDFMAFALQLSLFVTSDRKFMKESLIKSVFIPKLGCIIRPSDTLSFRNF